MKPTRRDFITTSGTLIAGGIIIPPFIKLSPYDKTFTTVKDYLDHFEVSVEILQKIIAAAMSKGGDYADLFFENMRTNSLGLEDGKVNRAYSNISSGVGIRVLKGDQTGFAYSETLRQEDMINAALMAANIAGNGSSFQPAGHLLKKPAGYYNILRKWDEVTVKDKVPFVQKINDKVFSLDNKVVKGNAFLSEETSRVLFFNSEGILTYDYRPMVSFGTVCIMLQNGLTENSYSARSFRKGYEWLTG